METERWGTLLWVTPQSKHPGPVRPLVGLDLGLPSPGLHANYVCTKRFMFVDHMFDVLGPPPIVGGSAGNGGVTPLYLHPQIGCPPAYIYRVKG